MIGKVNHIVRGSVSFLVLALCCIHSYKLSAQISAGNDTTICGGSATLQATVITNGITFSGLSTLSLSDDQYSGVIPIGFNFTFYGNTYTQCLIASNNYITFDLTNASGYSPWSIGAGIPSSMLPTNAIMCPYQDINPFTGGIIEYGTVGTPPNRKFVVRYLAIPMYSCTTLEFCSAVILYEGSNRIETYFEDKPLCPSWNGGVAIHGLQNATGTLAHVVPGRNFPTQWTALNDAWEFVPGGPNNYVINPIPYLSLLSNNSVNWYTLSGTLIGTGLTITVSPAVTTSYIAQTQGCSASSQTYQDTVTVFIGSNLVSTTTNTDVTCNGACDGTGTVNTMAPPPLNYQWDLASGSQITQTATGLCPGTYVVSISDAVGCTGLDSVTVTEPTPMVETSLTWVANTCNASCDGSANIGISGGTTPYTFLWDDPSMQTDSSATALCAGVFHITATDFNGCTVIDSVTITEPAALNTVVSLSDETCPGNCDGAAVAVVSGGSTPYSYNWTPTPGNGQGTTSASQMCSGSDTLYVTDVNNCQLGTPFVIGAPPQLVIASSTYTDATCNGYCDGTAQLTPGGGTVPYSFLWPSGSTSANETGLCAGTTLVTVTDSNNCSVTESFNIGEPTQLTVTVSPDQTICQAQSAQLSVSASGGTSPYTYIWDQGLPGSSTQTVTPASNTCYSVYATDANSCLSTPQTTCVSLLPPLNVTAAADQNICDGDDAVLDAASSGGTGGPYTYNWSNGGGTSQTATIFPSGYPANQTYVVTLSDGCSPAVSDTLVVSFYPTPVVSFGSNVTDGCEPLSVAFTNYTPNTAACSWDLGNGNVSSSSSTFTEAYNAGTYDVTLSVTTNDGCTATHTESAYVNSYPLPTAMFSADPQTTDINNTHIFFIDQSIGIINQWTWTFWNTNSPDILGNSFEENPEFQFPQDTGYYQVDLQVVTDHGCLHDTTEYVYIDAVYAIWIPNAFTPDNDGHNDYFFPKGIFISPDHFVLYVFDRWGELIYVTKDINEPWDGEVKKSNKPAPQGVYVWRIETAEATRGKSRHVYSGHVTLIR